MASGFLRYFFNSESVGLRCRIGRGIRRVGLLKKRLETAQRKQLLFAVFGDGIAVIGNLGEHVQNGDGQIRADASGKSDQQKHSECAGNMDDVQAQNDACCRAEPEQCLRAKLDFFPMCSNIAGLLCFSWFHAKMIPLFFQLYNHISPF